MVIIPLFEMAPDPEIAPSFQTRVPFWRIVSDAFMILLPVVFSDMVWPAPIVNGRPTVPLNQVMSKLMVKAPAPIIAVSYTHLRAHETPEHLVCRLLLEK